MRFGDEVHERLVDALVGSIYAADTDRFSLAMVPQLTSLAEGQRSLCSPLGARSGAGQPARRCSTPHLRHGVAGDSDRSGVHERRSALIRCSPVDTADTDGRRWEIDGERPTRWCWRRPPMPRAPRGRDGARARRAAGAVGACRVAIVTLAVAQLPSSMRGTSGYLVPKPDQRLVTAASFGSQKWEHWRDGDEVVRASLGRDGLPVDHLDDASLVDAAVSELGRHLGADVQPSAVRVSRWPLAFPQYRPGHLRWLAAVESATPPGLFLTGASYRGIGVPACIADAERTATQAATYLDRLRLRHH